MKNVFLKAYMAINLGDDLFIKILIERYPNVQFHIVAPELYKDIFKDNGNITVYKVTKGSFLQKIKGLVLRHIFPQLYREFLKRNVYKQIDKISNTCDLFLSIGGSVFMQKRVMPFYFDVEYYKRINQIFTSKPIFFLGGNFGPFSDKKYKIAYEQIFSNAYDVCFREEYSYKLFEDIENVRYASDIVFNMNMPQIQKIDKSIGFSIVAAEDRVAKEEIDDYYNHYSRIIEYFISERGMRVKLFSFCKEQGDERAIGRILTNLSDTAKTKVKAIFYNGQIDQFIQEFGSVEQMFCGRFHAMILSLLFKQNIYPVAYSDKMLNVLKDINYLGSHVTIDNLSKKKPEDYDTEIFNNYVDISETISSAEKQFFKLDKLLGEKV